MRTQKIIMQGIILFIVATLMVALAGAERAAVQIQGNAFSPSTVTVVLGDSVQWTNKDNTPHTVTSDTNAFNLGTLQHGNSVVTTLPRAGTFLYHCAIVS